MAHRDEETLLDQALIHNLEHGGRRLLKLDEMDQGQIVNFIARYRFKGPESA